MSDRWRYACPQGHRAIRRTGCGYHCNTCRETYDGNPIDLVSEEVPA